MTDIRAIAAKSEGDERAERYDYEGASVAYREAVRIDPGFLQAWIQLLSCYERLGKTEEAAEAKARILGIQGEVLSGKLPQPLGEPPSPGTPYKGTGTEQCYYLASSWDRWFAYLLDSLLVVVVLLVPAILVALQLPEDPGWLVIFLPVFFFVYWLYFAFFEAGERKATPGKRVLGIVVTDDYGHRLSLGHSLVRSFLKILFTISPFSLLTLVNGIVISSSADAKGLHDYLANTVVITKKVTGRVAFSSDSARTASNRTVIIIVAVILLVLFLIMAAVVAAFVFGMMGSTGPMV